MRANPLKIADLVTFTEEILNGNFHFMYSVALLAQYGINLLPQSESLVF